MSAIIMCNIMDLHLIQNTALLQELTQWYIHDMFYLVSKQLQVCIIGSNTENVVRFGTQRIACKVLLVLFGEVEHGENTNLQWLEELITGLIAPWKGFPHVLSLDVHGLQLAIPVMQPNHGDQVVLVDSFLLTLPWDPGKLIRQELWLLCPVPSDKLHQLSADVQQWWDRDSSSRRPDWGQDGFKGERNVTDGTMGCTADVLGWAGDGPGLQVTGIEMGDSRIKGGASLREGTKRIDG
jgi:hypothetical protein